MTIALLIGVAVLGWIVFTFNRLIRLRQLGDNAWSDIDVQLKRRHDLIPNVVAVVQGHAGYERGTLEALVAAPSERSPRNNGPTRSSASTRAFASTAMPASMSRKRSRRASSVRGTDCTGPFPSTITLCKG